MLQRFLFQIQEMGFFHNAKTVISYSKTQSCYSKTQSKDLSELYISYYRMAQRARYETMELPQYVKESVSKLLSIQNL